MQLEITDPERDCLNELLQSAHTEVLHELHHTDTHDYKEILRGKAKVIESLQEKLRGGK